MFPSNRAFKVWINSFGTGSFMGGPISLFRAAYRSVSAAFRIASRCMLRLAGAKRESMGPFQDPVSP